MYGVKNIQLYPFFRIAIALMAGILVAKAMDNPMPGIWMACAIGVYLMAVVSYFLFKTYWGACLLFLACFFLGGWRMSIGLAADMPSASCLQPSLKSGIPQDYSQAVFLTEPQVHGKVIMTRMMFLDGKYRGKSIPVSILRDTVSNKWKELHEGDGIIVRA